MENKIKIRRKTPLKMSYEEALAIAMKEFYKVHPPNTMPDWMSYMMPPRIQFADEPGIIFIKLGDYKRYEFGLDYSLKKEDGKEYILHSDPKTGKTSVVMSYTPEVYITVFEAKLNLETLKIEILIDSDFSALTPEDFDGYCYINKIYFTN